MCQVTLDITPFWGPLEHTLWEELLPAFLGVDSDDINNEFRELLEMADK